VSRPRQLAQRLRSALRTPAGKLGLKLLSLVFTVGLAGYLAFQLTLIGWGDVLASVPRTPLFYLAFLGFYFSSPLFETLAYRRLWGCPPQRIFPVLMKKRVYSRHVLDYSGEAYLYLWARKSIPRPHHELLHTIKDNMIVSSTSSALVAVISLLGLLLAEQVALPARMLEQDATYVAAGAVAAMCIAAVVVRLRHRILWLPPRLIYGLAGIHVARLASMLLLELLMWTTVDSTVPLRSWLSLLAVEIVITRIPFLPNRDLVLFGTGLEVAAAIQVGLPLIAGMLLTASIMEKTLNLSFFGLFSLLNTEGGGSATHDQEAADLLAQDNSGAECPAPGDA
jgi:hypothetical protein